MSEIVIRLEGLTKRFGSRHAVRDLSFEVQKGDLFGFLGPNGAGKSTTLYILLGLVYPTSGRVQIFEKPPSDLKCVKPRIGSLVETPSFYPYLSAKKNLEASARLLGPEALKTVPGVLERVGLSHAARMKVRHFSSGMKQRLGLTQALIHNPQLLILDEPTANLDPTGRMSILDKLKEISTERGVTIFISSHILSELEQLVDSVTLINKGRVLAEDSMQNLKKAYARNRYLLKTSDNEAILEAVRIEARSLILDSWLDGEGFVHLVSEDSVALKQELVKALYQAGALLEHFSEEEVSLETIYRKEMGLEAG